MCSIGGDGRGSWRPSNCSQDCECEHLGFIALMRRTLIWILNFRFMQFCVWNRCFLKYCNFLSLSAFLWSEHLQNFWNYVGKAKSVKIVLVEMWPFFVFIFNFQKNVFDIAFYEVAREKLLMHLKMWSFNNKKLFILTFDYTSKHLVLRFNFFFKKCVRILPNASKFIIIMHLHLYAYFEMLSLCVRM